jgi:adenine deaminase
MNQPANQSSHRGRRRSDLALLRRRVRVARGAEPGDLLLRGGTVVNVFTGQLDRADVVIADGWIAGVGPYAWQARETIELDGGVILPGLIDGHMHLESTLLVPSELARLVVPQGTAAIIADPHEIANVQGVAGIEMLLAASAGLPLEIFFMAPSCVPATALEDAGAALDAASVRRLLRRDRVLGLAEVMDFPAVLDARPAVLRKILAARRKRGPVDGHAPGLRGQSLMTYVAAGPRACHESTAADEAQEKAALGMMVQVREGSSEKNLAPLLPLLVADTLGDWCLATDDVLPNDLVAEGHINARLRRVVQAGVPVGRAVRHATLVPARHYGLADRGAVAPGYRANLAVVDDAVEFRPRLVIHDGTVVARDGQCLWSAAASPVASANTVRLASISEQDFTLATSGRACPVITLVPGQIVTRRETVDVRTQDGRWVFTPQQDVALLACLERHRATGRHGLGLVSGFRFQRDGALGSSVGHDSHNLLVAGTNAGDMLACAAAVAGLGGGFVVAAGGRIVAELPLPVAGLMSTADASTVCRGLVRVNAAVADLGCPLAHPFTALSFLALPVIPELRLTPRGLIDVLSQQWVPMP